MRKYAEGPALPISHYEASAGGFETLLNFFEADLVRAHSDSHHRRASPPAMGHPPCELLSRRRRMSFGSLLRGQRSYRPKDCQLGDRNLRRSTLDESANSARKCAASHASGSLERRLRRAHPSFRLNSPSILVLPSTLDPAILVAKDRARCNSQLDSSSQIRD